jgi:Integrase core domain
VISPATAPNEEWSIDFEGWFRTVDGSRCDSLTLTDAASRYLLDVHIVEPTWAGVRDAMERIFDEVGLPEAIRSDNRSPFGSTGAGGLSALSVWWLKLGIEPRYIPPSSPQDNGRHERMHRILKAQTPKPAAATFTRRALENSATEDHGPSVSGWIDSISPVSAASLSVFGLILRSAAAFVRLSQGSTPSAAGRYTGIQRMIITVCVFEEQTGQKADQRLALFFWQRCPLRQLRLCAVFGRGSEQIELPRCAWP